MAEPIRLSRSSALAASFGAVLTGALVGVARTGVRAQSLTMLQVGSGSVEDNAESFYAIDAGIFKKNGIGAQLSILRGGAVQISAVIAGQLDAAEASTVAFGSAVSRGVALTAVAPGLLWDARYPNAAIVVKPTSPIQTGKDLNNKTIGVTALGALGFLGVNAYMDATGGDRSTVRFIEIPSSALAEAVSSERIDAAVMDEPGLSEAVGAGRVRSIVDALNGISRLFTKNVWFVRKEWLAQNKDTSRRFADSIVAAGAWAEANRPQSLDILAKYTSRRMAKSDAQFGRKLDPKLVQPAWDAAYKYKLYASPLKAADYCWDGR
jgi:ABC-type nitrate/sulfonate/bicarbonate transport system substrate-binding protein